MGAEQSTTGAAPRFFEKQWRDIPWEDQSSALKAVKDYKPQTEGQQLRILLYGPVGAGKSSFINSVQSILHGRMYAQALADNTSHDCFTKRYTTYKIPKMGPEPFYPFVFNDIRGLHPHKGVLVNDVKLAMMGHVKEGYMFSPESTLTDLRPNAFYNEHQTDNDKVHVLVCVVPANTVSQVRDETCVVPANTGSQVRDETVQKIREIREEATKLGIPQVAILTRIDEACPEIKDDLKNVYKIKYLKEKVSNRAIMATRLETFSDITKIEMQPPSEEPLPVSSVSVQPSNQISAMQQFSVDVGIPMNCIFPVKNYHEEIDLNSDIDSLILSSLKSIINFGDDFIKFHKSQSDASVTYA